jgi:hypothetical protein
MICGILNAARHSLAVAGAHVFPTMNK